MPDNAGYLYAAYAAAAVILGLYTIGLIVRRRRPRARTEPR